MKIRDLYISKELSLGMMRAEEKRKPKPRPYVRQYDWIDALAVIAVFAGLALIYWSAIVMPEGWPLW